ncbi:ATPase H(+)-transporting accessory protein 2 [Halyomorpha halys]|uniref:ATPase H(+)-transporting accessory protein 2 n=1 Tax=Halyomorpha halys TaxID=286706 RepID=UPI0006D50560|nr:renin receptor [Halyomorpha halys]
MFSINIFIFSFLFIYVNGAGEFCILQTPESIRFSGQEQLDLSSVKNVLSSACGFTIPECPRWSGMAIESPFNFAEGVVVVAVPGVASLDSVQGRTYPLNTDESLESTWHAISSRMADRFPTADNMTLNYVNVNDPSKAVEVYGTLSQRDSPSVEYLKLSSPEDKAFIDQINTLDAITSKIADKGVNVDGLPDIHWFTVPGLHNLVDMYGITSKQVLEAKRLISSSVLLLSEVFTTAYDDKVIFTVLSSDAIHTRRYRRQAESTSAETDSTTAPTTNENEAKASGDVDEDFPVMFNIFLWTTVAFILILLACSVGIAQMDPGRDSIIYRMTSNRMKKDQ